MNIKKPGAWLISGITVSVVFLLHAFFSGRNGKESSARDFSNNSAKSKRERIELCFEERVLEIVGSRYPNDAEIAELGRSSNFKSWDKFLALVEERSDHTGALGHYLRGWAEVSFDDAWAAAEALKDDPYGKLAAFCLKGASLDDLRSLEGRFMDSEGRIETTWHVRAALWERWGELAPQEAIERFFADDSLEKEGISDYLALVDGLEKGAGAGNLAEAIPHILAAGKAADAFGRAAIYEAMSHLSIQEPSDFEALREGFSRLQESGGISEQDRDRYLKELHYTAIRNTPEYFLTSAGLMAKIPKGYLDMALFEVAKEDLGRAFEAYEKMPGVADGEPRHQIAGFVNRMMSYDPRGFGDHLNTMKAGPTKDQAIATMVQYLDGKEAHDQAAEWLEVIGDAALRKKVAEGIATPARN